MGCRCGRACEAVAVRGGGQVSGHAHCTSPVRFRGAGAGAVSGAGQPGRAAGAAHRLIVAAGPPLRSRMRCAEHHHDRFDAAGSVSGGRHVLGGVHPVVHGHVPVFHGHPRGVFHRLAGAARDQRSQRGPAGDAADAAGDRGIRHAFLDAPAGDPVGAGVLDAHLLASAAVAGARSGWRRVFGRRPAVAGLCTVSRASAHRPGAGATGESAVGVGFGGGGDSDGGDQHRRYRATRPPAATSSPGGTPTTRLPQIHRVLHAVLRDGGGHAGLAAGLARGAAAARHHLFLAMRPDLLLHRQPPHSGTPDLCHIWQRVPGAGAAGARLSQRPAGRTGERDAGRARRVCVGAGGQRTPCARFDRRNLCLPAHPRLSHLPPEGEQKRRLGQRERSIEL
eukprot:ctg_1093.g452